MPGLPVHHHLPEFTQTHVHRVSDAIQPSHPQSTPSPPAPNPSQHQSFPVSQLFTSNGAVCLTALTQYALVRAFRVVQINSILDSERSKLTIQIRKLMVTLGACPAVTGTEAIFS